SASATLTVYDVTGKVLRIVEGDYAKGYNEVTLKRNEISATGVLYYQLDTEDYSATKKMIIIE
ncbi:MAG: T9SS type A sorting domain-containing protein, partial [Bacteroidota bacterium]